MKIGLSLSRCVKDIVEGKVDFDDVLVIIARTDFDPHEDAHWEGIWMGYRYGGVSAPEWEGAEPHLSEDAASEVYRNVTKSLYDAGKLHQPRQFNAHPKRLPYYWLETFAPEEEVAKNPTALKAWEKYKTIAGLSL